MEEAKKILVTIRDIAAKAGVSVPQVKYWIKLLGLVPIIRARMAYLEEEDAMTVHRMAEMVAGGATPREAAGALGKRGTEAEIIPVPTVPESSDHPMISKHFGQIEAAILALVEENRRLAGQVTALQGDIGALREETAAVRYRLEAPPPKPVKVWEPTRLEPPPVPWYQRIWLELTAPEKLRALEP